MAQKRINLFDLATKGNKLGGPSNVPGGGGTRDPYVHLGAIGSVPYGEQMGAPGWTGPGTWMLGGQIYNPSSPAFGGEPGSSGFPGSGWFTGGTGPNSFDTWWPDWDVTNMQELYDWYTNAPGAPGSGMDFMGYESDLPEYNVDYNEWFGNIQDQWGMGSGGTNIGGPGDWGLGTMFGNYTQEEGPPLDCDFMGPQYMQDGSCYACCEGEIVDECADGPIFDENWNCISCCGDPIAPSTSGIY